MILGVDEVGRGCWAGPLVAAVVGFTGEPVEDLNDSKVLSAKKRTQLDKAIRATASVVGIGWVWPEEINKIGLTESVRLAMQRAVDGLVFTSEDEVIIDGNIDYLELSNSVAIVKADGSVPAVSAASIVAKVARDNYMHILSAKHPQYGFDKHVGYGTRRHIIALKTHGVLSTVHRLNYKPIQALTST